MNKKSIALSIMAIASFSTSAQTFMLSVESSNGKVYTVNATQINPTDLLVDSIWVESANNIVLVDSSTQPASKVILEKVEMEGVYPLTLLRGSGFNGSPMLIAKQEQYLGGELSVINYGGGIDTNVSEFGEVADFERASAEVYKHFGDYIGIKSASAVTNNCGELLGVNVAGKSFFGNPIQPDSYRYTTSVTSLKHWLESNDIRYQIAPDECLSTAVQNQNMLAQAKAEQEALKEKIEKERKEHELSSQKAKAQQDKAAKEAQAKHKAELEKLEKQKIAKEKELAEIAKAEQAAKQAAEQKAKEQAELEQREKEAALEAFERAKVTNTVESLKEFIFAYPTSDHVLEAKAMLELLEQSAEAKQQEIQRAQEEKQNYLLLAVGIAVLISFILILVLRKRKNALKLQEMQLQKTHQDNQALNQEMAAAKERAVDVLLEGVDVNGNALNLKVNGSALALKGEQVLGRSPSKADLVLSFDEISRVHALFRLTNGSITITDLNSANGSQLNRNALLPNEPQPLNNGDVLSFSSMSFTVKFVR
ncbi:FHA domain-containing protein [Vibrio chaetopteri]|uniref:FHA domain-containing protein n=1 Tax=Vibrio chaetopteri TaxID=3016528 RepID=UPI003AB172DC